jgi:hypothetical protein
MEPDPEPARNGEDERTLREAAEALRKGLGVGSEVIDPVLRVERGEVENINTEVACELRPGARAETDESGNVR